MSFALADGEYITNDRELFYYLMRPAGLIVDLEPIEYEVFGFDLQMKL